MEMDELTQGGCKKKKKKDGLRLSQGHRGARATEDLIYLQTFKQEGERS